MDIYYLLSLVFSLTVVLYGIFLLSKYLQGYGIAWFNPWYNPKWPWKLLINPKKTDQSEKYWLLFQSVLIIVLGFIGLLQVMGILQTI